MAVTAIAGTAFIKVDGVQYDLRGNFKVMPATTENTGVAGADGVHGYTQKYVVPSIEADLTDTGGLSITTIYGLTNSTVTLELVNGKVYVLNQAWYSGPTNLNAVEGTLPVKFEGFNCTEILAQ